MFVHSFSRNLPWIHWFAAAGVIAAGIYGAQLLASYDPSLGGLRRSPMLVAPMVGISDTCINVPDQAASEPPGLNCTGEQGSAAALLEATLAQLDASWLKSYSLGYTLPVPLLQLFRQEGEAWAIDQERVQRVTRTIRDSNRPLILYLFSTHFSSHSPLEKVLAQDPGNVAHTPSGALPEDSYYGAPIYNWSVATTDNGITHYRTRAIQALVEDICQLPARDVRKIRGITVLGELHQLFPSFETGMGFASDYAVTEYSPQSVAGFQNFLRSRFDRIEKLNLILKTRYGTFDEVRPPSKDIRKQALNQYEEHIDPFAHGTFPVSGWLFAPNSPSPRIHVYVNGQRVGTTAADLTRRDVLEAKPAFGHVNTGWRLDVDFRAMKPGLHGIDVYAELVPHRLTHLGHRQVAVMDREQRTPEQQPQHPLPASHAAGPGVEAALDQPQEHVALFYNPVVPFWHEVRGQQVGTYLSHFDRLLQSSCLGALPRYTHQLIPYANPSWDANKFAVDASLGNLLPLRAGISLYGEAAYGDSLRRWLRRSPHPSYGITEFHPLKPMSSDELRQVFAAHAARNADFLTFFLEPYWEGQALERTPNLFSFDSRNGAFGSDVLYEALRSRSARP